MWNYTLLAVFLPPQLRGLTGVAGAAENYVEALLAWAVCGGGDSKCFVCLENSLGGSLWTVLIWQ